MRNVAEYFYRKRFFNIRKLKFVYYLLPLHPMLFKKKKEMTHTEVEKILAKVATPMSLYLVPENEKAERDRFFKDSSYNPQFVYRKSNKNKGIFEQIDGLQEISDVDPAISSYIIHTIESKRESVALFDAIGKDDEFEKLSRSRFGVPSPFLFRKACRILRGNMKDFAIEPRNEQLANIILTFDQLEPIFNKVFQLLRLDGWTLEKSKAIASKGFRTVMKTRRIMVDPEIEVSAEKLKKTIIHEVATHALRGNNGYATGYEVFGKPNLREYLDDEEGMAMFNEEIFGVMRDIDVKKRAALVYAAYLAQFVSFRRLFEALSAVYPKNTAYDVCLRVKRGISDTSRPGGYYRDACYLRGYYKVVKKLTNDPVTYQNMYAGKIPLSHLSLVEEGVIPKPSTYPTETQVKEIFHIIESA